jgi:hypothetical protein
MRSFLITSFLIVAGSICAVAQSPLPGSKGNFTAKLELKAMKNQKTGRTPQLPFSGSYAHDGTRFRMELINDLTTESQVLIMDNGAKKGWMLFPDTLNGITADLAQLDSKGLVSQASSFMSGNFASVPKDWSKPVSKSITLDGKPATELLYTLPQITGKDGKKEQATTLTFWHRPDNAPVKIVLDSSTVKLTVDFSQVTTGTKLDSNQFKPDAKYKLRELGKGEAPPVPGGVPGGLF